MKKLGLLAFLVAFLAAGPAQAADLPDLLGTWSGPAEGIRPDGTVVNLTLIMTIDRQVGQLFAGNMLVDRLDAEGAVIEQESLLFTGHLGPDNRISMTLIPKPGEAEELPPPLAAAMMNATLSGNKIIGVWDNLTWGNTGWTTLTRQAPSS